MRAFLRICANSAAAAASSRKLRPATRLDDWKDLAQKLGEKGPHLSSQSKGLGRRCRCRRLIDMIRQILDDFVNRFLDLPLSQLIEHAAAEIHLRH
jgi:hypothetical protein